MEVSHTPPRELITDRLVIRPYVASDAKALVEGVTESIEELRPWMPWISFEPMSVEDRISLIAQWTDVWDSPRQSLWEPADKESFVTGIFDRATGEYLGGHGYHMRKGRPIVELGYWIRTSKAGRGYVTEATAAATEAALALPDVSEVWICCDEANERSSAVPQRLGYELRETCEREPEAPGETGRAQTWVRSR